MKAAVMTQFREPLEVQELPDPQPGPGDAVIKVMNCGVCRSDWHLWQQDWTWLGVEVKLPHVMGHEFGGVVEEVGAEVSRFKSGDRVTVPFHMACGSCEYCYSGRSNICMAHGVIGAHFFGGYGNYAMVPAADVNLVGLPDEVDFLSAAALGCRYMTAYHGIVDIGDVRPGEWVAVFGIGGVGIAAVQIASALGARVIAVSNTAGKLEQARREGAVETLTAGENVPEAIRELTGGGAHVAVDALGSAKTVVPAVMSLRKGGRHVNLGLTGQDEKGMITLPVDAIVFNEWTFRGSVGCPTTSYPGMLSMVASGRLAPGRLVANTVPVEGASAVLESMSDFSTRGFHIIEH